MSNPAFNDNPEVQKRRSSRIVQAVPLTVTGVDALGRPFLERTSTLIINSHGCRYQSKHYVLKNMWVTLQVPHSEPGHEPRSVRARVMWIRRPHTVRELFQVGVELESAGNIWGIAFPPPDWFAFPEGASASMPPPEFTNVQPPLGELPPESHAEALGEMPEGVGVEAAPAAPSEPEAPSEFGPVSAAPGDSVAEMPQAEPAANSPDNLRTIPLSGEPSVILARQMSRLVNEARQQLHTAVRESAAQAISAETRPLIAALHHQLRDAARLTIEAAAEHVLQNSLDQTSLTAEARLEQARAYWNRQLQEGLDQAVQNLNSRLGELETERRAGFTSEIENTSRLALENLGRVTADLETRLSEARQHLETLTGEAQQKFDHLAQQADNAAMNAQSAWPAQAMSQLDAQLNAQVDAAGARFNERVEASIENAVQEAVNRLTQRSQSNVWQVENDARQRIESAGQGFLNAANEAEQRLVFLKNSFEERAFRAESMLAQVESLTYQVEQHGRQLEAVRATALQEMENRAASLLEAQSLDLDQRASALLSGWTERVQPAIEFAGQQTIERLAGNLEFRLQEQFNRSAQVIEQLPPGNFRRRGSSRRHEESITSALRAVRTGRHGPSGGRDQPPGAWV